MTTSYPKEKDDPATRDDTALEYSRRRSLPEKRQGPVSHAYSSLIVSINIHDAQMPKRIDTMRQPPESVPSAIAA